MVNTSGCGSHYVLRQYYMSHYISGQKVACLLMKIVGTKSVCQIPIRGLNTLNGELHWECFCELSPSRVVNLAHRSLNDQLSPCVFPRRPSCLRVTMVGIPPPQHIVGGYIFRRHNVQPIRRYQCAPLPDRQTSAPTFPSSQGTRRVRHRTGHGT